jgi:hypothetical protein
VVALNTSLALDPSAAAAPASSRDVSLARLDRRTTVGVVLAALVCFGLSAFAAFRLPPFFGADERPHLAYTVSLLEGRLPEITDRQPFSDRYPIIERSLDPPGPEPPRPAALIVATHPPLAYVLAAPAVWLAATSDSDAMPTLAFRLVNALAMATGVVLAGLLAAELFPRHSGIAVSAAVLTAVVPNLAAIAGYAQNDGTAFALTTACLLVSARLLRRGLSPGRVAGASLVAGAAMLTRASAAIAVAAVVASAVVAAWRRGGGVWRVVARASGVGLVIGGTVAASAGWFYLRNRRLYGTATADRFLLEGLGRPHRGSVAHVLGDGEFLGAMWSQVYGSVHTLLVIPHPGWVVAALVGVGAVGLILAAARRLVRRDQAATAGAGIGAVGWLIIIGFCAGVIVATARYYAEGGGPHPRYFFSIVPVVSALLARALTELPWRRTALAVVAGGLLAVTVSQSARYDDLIRDPTRYRPFEYPTAGTAAQWGAIALVVGAVTALVAWLFADWWGWREVPGEPALAGRSDNGAEASPGPVPAMSEMSERHHGVGPRRSARGAGRPEWRGSRLSPGPYDHPPDFEHRRHGDDRADDRGGGDHLARHRRPGHHRP